MLFDCWKWIQHPWYQLVCVLWNEKYGDIESLPDDVIIEILSRVPADDVLKCQRVCKKWRTLTSTHHFTEKHLKRACPISFVQHFPRLLEDRKELELYVLDEKLKSKRVWSRYMHKFFGYDLVLAASCDGLLVFRSNFVDTLEFFICNPVTQEVLTLRQPYVDGRVFEIFFHSLSKEYRLLYSRPISGNLDEFFILSLGSKSWRRLTSSYKLRGGSVVFDKSIHWIARLTPCTNSMVVFNVDSEEFKRLPHPGKECSPSGQCQKWMMVSKFERYGLSLYITSNEVIDVWVLKDHGKWNWDKTYQVSRIPFLHGRIKIGTIKNKELFLHPQYERCILYNLQTKTMKDVKAISSVHAALDLLVFDYTKSLVSLKDLYAHYEQNNKICDPGVVNSSREKIV